MLRQVGTAQWKSGRLQIQEQWGDSSMAVFWMSQVFQRFKTSSLGGSEKGGWYDSTVQEWRL